MTSDWPKIVCVFQRYPQGERHIIASRQKSGEFLELGDAVGESLRCTQANMWRVMRSERQKRNRSGKRAYGPVPTPGPASGLPSDL